MKQIMMLCLCWLGLSAIGVSSCKNNTQKTDEEPFKYAIDEFADIQILRYQVPGWDSLSLQQKEYIYHLAEAAKCGRDILFDQNFKYNLPIRKTIETILENYKGDTTSIEYKNFVVYAKRVFFSNGIHHHYAEDKFIPGCSQDYFKSLMEATGQGEKCAELLPIIFDPTLYAQRQYQGSEKDLLLGSAVNFYDGGVTKEEANTFYAKMAVPNDKTPISYGLNSKLVKENGVLKEEVYKIGGLYNNSISQIVKHLTAAMAVAENKAQKNYIEKLINYYTTGDLKTWDEYNIAWVTENQGTIDFINGFIEDYSDPLGRKANWEGNVSFTDMEASRRTKTISENAQWFEDNSPIETKFKKKEVKGVTARVITVACLGGDSYPATPIGINLPNADWIRKDYGSKSVTIANITDAYDKATQESPNSTLKEFSWDESTVKLAKEYGTLTNDLHTDLHECLGHGSGQLLPGTEPNALKEYSSALEEARADLFALYYLADHKLVELGILPNDEAYKAEYNSYFLNGMMVQLSRIELGKTVTEAHMQNRKLIAEWCYKNGLKENNQGAKSDVIEKRTRNGKSYFVINDYTKLRTLVGNLLAEIQRIKSEGDYKAGKKLIADYAVKIDPALHKEVKERYDALHLKPYRGFVNPDIIAVTKNGKVVDYKIEYCGNYLKQMLNYGKNYSFEN